MKRFPNNYGPPALRLLIAVAALFARSAMAQAGEASGDDTTLTEEVHPLADAPSVWAFDSAESAESPYEALTNVRWTSPEPATEAGVLHYEFLPKDTLYPFYLADTKASRLAGQWLQGTADNTLLDGTLGGRFGVLRYVDDTPAPYTRGVQLDVEASAQVRLDMDLEHDVRSADFRAGVPLSASWGRLQARFGYYHLSSHVGDEYLLRYPQFDRQNYSRDVLFVGGAFWLDDRTRLYGEAGWAFYYDVCEPWEFVLGVDSAPRRPTGPRGAPFYAVNGRLREEADFGGDVSAQLGWAWRSSYDSGLLRTGLYYFNGKSNQYSFYDQHEELVGAAIWYDF
jgi:hypothetical protein